MSQHAPPMPPPESLLEHTRFLRRLARRLVRGDEADDLTQDTLHAALRAEHLPRARRAWLAGTMRNLARMRARADVRRKRRERGVAGGAATVSSPDDVAARLDVQRRVVEAVTELAEPYRSTVVYRYFHDLPPARIAELTGAPVATVHTRLTRAHGHLRAALDRGAGGRAAWAAPLAATYDGRATSTHLLHGATWSVAMKAKANVLWILLPLLGALVGGGLVMVTQQADPDDDARTETLTARVKTLETERDRWREEAARLRERLADGTPTSLPGLRGQPAPDAATKPAPVPAPAPARQPKGGATTAAAPPFTTWKAWIPVLEKYGALRAGAAPSEEALEGLQKFLQAVQPHLRGRRWHRAADMFAMSDIVSNLALSALEHAGATLDAPTREALRTKTQGEVDQALKLKHDPPLKIERFAAAYAALARMHAVLSEASTPERAASATALMGNLMRSEGWNHLTLGSVDYATFEGAILQFWGIRAQLDKHEREETSHVIRAWWDAARSSLADFTREHGAQATNATLRPASEDTPAAAAARREPTFAGVEASVHAALARHQAVAERAFQAIWLRIPEARRGSFDDVEPSLFLFVPK